MAPPSLPPVAPEIFGKLMRSSSFWTALVHSAAVAVERGAPDYTIGHHIAATLDSLLGYNPVSTPTARDALPPLQAALEGVKAGAPVVVAVVDQVKK